MAPFLVAALLPGEHEAVFAQHPHHVAGRADGEFLTHGALHGQFDKLGVLRQRRGIGLESEFERLGLGVARGGAAGQLREHGGKAAGLRILFDDDAEFHGSEASRFAPSGNRRV